VRELLGVGRLALEGSRPADSLTVWAWRGGSLLFPDPLQVVDWSESDDAGDAVKVGHKWSLTVADPEGRLGAWSYDDALSVAGSELRIIYNIGGSVSVNMGWFRVVGNEPDEVTEWRLKPEYGLVVADSDESPHERWEPVTRAVVRLECVDRSFNVDRDKFDWPQSPGSGASVIGEVRRLAGQYCPVVPDEGVPDAGVSSQLVYERERLESIQDLLSRVGARYRMGGSGEMQVYSPRAAPVWRVEPRHGLISVARKQSIDGLFNRWIVEGKTPEGGAAVVGFAQIDFGPLRYGGPHGRASTRYSSDLIDTPELAARYAAELRDRFLASMALVLEVQTIPRPELQAGDRVEVGCPVGDRVAYFPGEVTSKRCGGSPVPGPMSLSVSVSYGDVMAALARTEWADNLTSERPALTWARMPGTWGNLPEMTWNEIPQNHLL
jgi:hypothetical protein